MSASRFLAPFLLLAVLGCGDPIKEETVTPPTVAPKDAIKAALTPAAESGQVGSEIGGIMEHIRTIKSTDAALGASLEQDANSLMQSSGNPEAVKAKIKAMLQKLDAAGGQTAAPAAG